MARLQFGSDRLIVKLLAQRGEKEIPLCGVSSSSVERCWMELARTRTDELVKPERLFRALGDRTRLRIVWLLRQGELSGGELAATLSLTPAVLSRHMRSLCQARIVVQRRHEIGSLYQLAVPHDALGIRVWNMLADMGNALAEAQADLVRLQEVRTDVAALRMKVRSPLR